MYVPKVSFNIDRCKGCGLCVDACPKKIIELSRNIMNAKGFHPAQVIDQEKCIACAFCATMCPDVIITVEK
ncbi:MAG: 4Fe-4S binding protein [Clostridiales bacterium]|nr:4Fe-4S binding protein [Clostridiales bacterium]